MSLPCWLRRAARNRHRHAIEQASRRWRGGRREDSARTRHEILISTQVLEGVAEPLEINMAGPRLEALQTVLIESAAKHNVVINGTRAVTKMKASSYKGATRIDYSFYTWITEEGIRNKTATNIMARTWLMDYKTNLVTQCADGTMNDILEDHAWTAEYTANSTLTQQLLFEHEWRPHHVTEVDTTSMNLDTTLRVTMTSSLKFNSSSLDADAFNSDATSVSQFKEVISRVWPNVTADAVEDVVAEEESDKKLVRIRYSFDDYVVAHGATVQDANNESEAYKTSFVSRSKKQATNGKLQTHISDVCSGNRRRLQSSAFSSAQADPVACAAAIETETVSEVEVMNTAPSPNPTLSPTLSHAPTTYTPTTAPPSATPSYVPTTYEPTLSPTKYCGDDVCWADQSVKEFDCDKHTDPIQVLEAEGSSTYSLREWSSTGDFELIHELDYFDGHVNAVGMYEGPFDGTQYALGAFTEDPDNDDAISYLCRFDNKRKVCFEDQPLHVLKPNAGAVLGLDYYYGLNLGRDATSRGLYWVENIHNLYTISHEDVALEISEDLYGGGVYDFTAIVEDGRDVFDDDYNKDGKYLVGLADDASLIVIHVADSGAPDAYAVLDTEVDWALAPTPEPVPVPSPTASPDEEAYSYEYSYTVSGLDCFNETLNAFACYLDLYPDDDAAMFEALQDPTLMGDDDRWNSSGTDDDVSLSDDVTSCVDVQADAGFAEACTAQPQIVQDACGAKFDAVAECAYESWALEAGLDCDLDCDQVSRRRKLGVLDWARRLFSSPAKRPSTSPNVIRRKARDAVLDVLRGPPPTTSRRNLKNVKDVQGAFSDVKFGAAYSYRWREDDPRWLVLFSENGGRGLFQLETDAEIKIPKSCWNKASDKLSKHARCGETAQLMYVGPSSISDKNDGLNCYEGGFLQPAPTNSPTEAPCLDRICWETNRNKVAAFDCENHPYPIQVFKYSDSDYYSVKELDQSTGAYNDVFDLTWVDSHINAAALYDAGEDGSYAFASMGGELCRFDASDKVCFDTALQLGGKPNVGAIIDTTYYYARSLGDGKSTGRAIYTVDGLQHDAPTFYDDILVEFSEDVISGKILDFAGVKEDAGGVCVTTACDGRYLLGLAKDFSLVLVRINGDSHLPEAYAYLPSYVDWSLAQGLFGANFTGVTETQEGFGAAYAYEINAVNLRVFFTANAGEGLFEVVLPIDVDALDGCWNEGTDRSAHAACASAPAGTSVVVWAGPSDSTSSNDGLNCKDGMGRPTPQPTHSRPPTSSQPSRMPTPQPSYEPTPKPSPQPTPMPTSFMYPRWEDDSVQPWDCAEHNWPLQILKEEGASSYSLEELDTTTGLYNKLYDMPGDPSHVNAAAMHIGAQEIYDDDFPTVYTMMAAIDGHLCRFDSNTSICFETALEEKKPNSGAILSNTYFYGKSIGKYGGERFYYVEDINTDTPKFHDDYKFKVSSNLFAGQILDVSAALEIGDEIVEDGQAGMQYLIGMGGNYEVFVVRIGPTGEPEAYAVVPSDVVSAGSERAVPGLIEGVAGGTNYGNIGVACSSPLNEFVENFAFASADDCWSSCAAAHGEALVAVTFYPADNGCYCQDDCTCLEACDDCELVARQGMQPPDNCASGDAQYSYSYACGEEESAVLACMFDAQASGTVLDDDFYVGTTDDAADDDDGVVVETCADVQGAPFFVESCASAPAVCGDLVRRLFECSYEHQAAEVLGLDCSLNCSSTLAPTPAPVAGAAPATPAPVAGADEVTYSYEYSYSTVPGLDCFNETLNAFACYLDLYPDDDAAMLEALQDPTLMGDDDRWNSSGISDDVSPSDDVASCADVQADAGFAEACTAQPQIVQDACGAKFDAVAECAYESWALEAGLDCDLDCDQVSRRRQLGVLDWAWRLFSSPTKRPSTSPQAIRRKARDAVLDVLRARPPPKTSSLLRRAAPRALRPRRRLEDATAATAVPTAMAGTAREETSFGASFMYRNDYETRLFFASNTGAGLFELILPVVVPDDCWNADKDWEDHVQCSSSVAALVRRSDAAEAASNDGLNCPLGGGPAILRYSSDAPTITPVPSSSPYPTTAAPTASLAPTTPSPTTAQPTPQPSTAAPSLAGSRAPTTAYPTATPTTPSPSATPTPRPTPMPTTATPTSSATTQGLFALKLVVDYGDLTAADGDVLCQAVLASLELAAGTDCEQVTFEPVSGRRRLQTTGYVVTIVLEATYHPSSEDDISSRLVGQLQDSLGDGSFTAALETAAAGTDSSLASLSYADLESGVLVDETNQILDEALAADPGQALVFTWTPTPKPTLTRRPTPSPTKAPVQSAPPTSVADYQASKASGGASADAAGTDAVIGSLIAVIFVVMVGYAGFQHRRQKQLEQEEKEGIEAGHFEGDEADPDFACEDVDPAKAVPIDDVEAPTEDDSRSVKSSEAMDSDVFFHQLMEQTAQASELASLPEGSAFEPSVVASEVGDDEWDAMLNDVDDEESTETWNEDLASTLLFKLAQGDCDEGFATRDRLAQALQERPDLLDMLGIMGISGDEIDFFLETIESDGDVVSRSQFLRVLERWRKSDTHSDSGTVSSKGLADLPPPAPPPRKMQPPAHPPPPGPPTPAGPVVDDDAASSATGPDVASRLFPPASPESAQEAAPLDSEDAELAKLAAMDARFAPPAPALPARPADADGGEAPPPGDDDDDEAPPPGDDDEDETPPPDDDDDEAEPPPAGPGGAPFSPDISLLQFTRRRRSAILAPGRRPPPPPPARGAWSPSTLFRPPSPDNLVAPAYERFRRARDNSPSDASPSPK